MSGAHTDILAVLLVAWCMFAAGFIAATARRPTWPAEKLHLQSDIIRRQRRRIRSLTKIARRAWREARSPKHSMITRKGFPWN